MGSSFKKQSLLGWTCSLIITAFVLLCYFNRIQALIVFLVLLCVYFFAGWKNALTVSLSLAFITLLLSLTLNFLKVPYLYYRPHEMLGATDLNYGFGNVYKSNAKVVMREPFGDLEAMSKVGIREPRMVVFETDSIGFRNDHDYSGEKLVLIGDSFGVGNGSTQECTISNQLRSKFGIQAYDLSHPGNLADYSRVWQVFKSIFKTDAKIILFLYEGNDFLPFSIADAEPREVSGWRRLFSKFIHLIHGEIYEFTQNRLLRAKQTMEKKSEPIVSVFKVKGSEAEMVFLNEYMDVAKNKNIANPGEVPISQLLEKLKPDIRCIFFIPDKFRVYQSFLVGAGDVLPNASWEYLKDICFRLGLPVVDLTPSLTARAKELLPQNKYVFWLDDTHWNCFGMSVAADEVARKIA